MELTLKIAKKIVQLINGETIADSAAKSKLIDDLVRRILFSEKENIKNSCSY